MKDYAMKLNQKNLCEYICFAILVIITLASHFWRYTFEGTGYLAHFDDDFFYYLKIAENISIHNISSFNTLYLTNGYHPLWMFVLVGILKITRTTGIHFFLIFSTILSILNISVYFLTRRLSLRFFETSVIPVFIAIIATLFSTQLMRSGMEIALTIVMTFIVMDYAIRNRNHLSEKGTIIIFGFLSSILVLSRLDSAVFVLIFLISPAFFDYTSLKISAKKLFFFGLGGLLVPLYLLSNLIFFDTLMPVSGQVKHLKDTLIPNINVYKSLILFRPSRFFIIPTLIGMAISLLVFFLGQYRKDKRYIPLIIPIAFCIVYYNMLAVSSDWHLWQWYAYPFVPCLVSTAIIIFSHISGKLPVKQSLISTGFVMLSAFFLLYGIVSTHRFITKITPDNNGIYIAAKKIAMFAQQYPGVYAMGDRAGMPGYLMDSPLIQLEGLVMDTAFSKNIVESRNLNDVLEEYDVNYYVSSSFETGEDGYLFVEPAQAKHSKFTMKGSLNQKPILEFTSPPGIRTAIFKIKEPEKI